MQEDVRGLLDLLAGRASEPPGLEGRAARAQMFTDLRKDLATW